MPDQNTLIQYALYAVIAIAILAPVIVYLRGASKLHTLRKEKDAALARLKEQLSVKMELESDLLGKLKAEREDLAKQNEELRIKVQEYRGKPGRDVLRQLQITERALALLHERAPGFGPAWQTSLKEANGEMEKSEKGLLAFARRTLLPGSNSTGGQGSYLTVDESTPDPENGSSSPTPARNSAGQMAM